MQFSKVSNYRETETETTVCSGDGCVCLSKTLKDKWQKFTD
jgi:hypothetical protein